METTNYSNGNKSLIYALIIVALLFICCSCGARKTEKSKTVTNETAVVQFSKADSSKTTTVTDSNIKIIDTGTEEEFTIVPIDSTKEMIIGGKTFFNASVKHKKTSKNKVVDKSKNVAKTVQNDVREASKSETKKTAVVEVKNVEKKQFNFLNLWWLLLIIPIYFGLKRLRVV